LEEEEESVAELVYIPAVQMQQLMTAVGSWFAIT
jgi:hypothetical protein